MRADKAGVISSFIQQFGQRLVITLSQLFGYAGSCFITNPATFFITSVAGITRRQLSVSPSKGCCCVIIVSIYYHTLFCKGIYIGSHVSQFPIIAVQQPCRSTFGKNNDNIRLFYVLVRFYRKRKLIFINPIFFKRISSNFFLLFCKRNDTFDNIFRQ